MNIYLLIALPTVLNQNCELDKTTYFSTRLEVRQRPTLWQRLSTQGIQTKFFDWQSYFFRTFVILGYSSSDSNLSRYQWNEWQLRREALAVASEGEKRSEAVQVGHHYQRRDNRHTDECFIIV